MAYPVRQLLRLLAGAGLTAAGAHALFAPAAGLICTGAYAVLNRGGLLTGLAAGAQEWPRTTLLLAVPLGYLAVLIGCRLVYDAVSRRGLLAVLASLAVAFLSAWSSGSGLSRTLPHSVCGAVLTMQPDSETLTEAYGHYPAFTARHNGLGLRGASPDDRPRVLVVGDSYIYGTGLQDTETIPSQLENLLPGYQVVNAGLPGDNAVGALQRAVHFMDVLEPRAVVVGFVSNDLNDTSTSSLCALPGFCRPRVPFSRLDHRLSYRVLREGPSVQMVERVGKAWSVFLEAAQARDIPVVVHLFEEVRGLELPLEGAHAGRVTLTRADCPPRLYFNPDQPAHPNPQGALCNARIVAAGLRSRLPPAPRTTAATLEQ